MTDIIVHNTILQKKTMSISHTARISFNYTTSYILTIFLRTGEDGVCYCYYAFLRSKFIDLRNSLA